MKKVFLRSVAVVGLVGWVLSCFPASAQLAYSFRAGDVGGAALLLVDDAGTITEHRLLVQEAACRKAKKVRFTKSGKRVGVTAATSKTPNLFVCSTEPGSEPVGVSLPGEPDELRAAGESFVISCEGGTIARVDAAIGKIANTFNARSQMTPPARNGEDVFVFPDEKQVLVSFESEHRLVLLDLPGLDLRANLGLPREAAGMEGADGPMGSGPQPEIVLGSRTANAIAASLDQYGAIGLLDLSAAMQGKLAGAVYRSTAPDGSWGNAFPDRGNLVKVNGKDHVLMTNSGPDGGAVLVDLAAREVVRRWDVPHGLEKPVFLPSAKIAVATPAGKLKQRGRGRTYVPGSAVYVFALDGPPAEAPVSAIKFNKKVFYAAAVAPGTSPLVALAVGDNQPDTIVILDPVAKRPLARQKAHGTIQRLESAL